jgi:hypothetical protein
LYIYRHCSWTFVLIIRDTKKAVITWLLIGAKGKGKIEFEMKSSNSVAQREKLMHKAATITTNQREGSNEPCYGLVLGMLEMPESYLAITSQPTCEC